MDRVNEVKPWKYFWAFVLATVVFVCIFLIAYAFSYFNYQGIYERNSEIGEYLENINVDEAGCDDPLLYETSDLLDIAGSRIGTLERRLGKNHWRVLEQKKLYTKLEIAHMDLVENLNEICAGDFLTVMFFYSNTDELEDASERQGYVLSSFKNTNPGRVMIYSFDYNLDSEEILKLRREFGISRVPVSVIDGRDLVYVRDIGDLGKYG